MEDIFNLVFLLLYILAGIWALNKIYYSRFSFIVINNYADFMFKKVCIALFFGWILIPIAIIVTLVGNKRK